MTMVWGRPRCRATSSTTRTTRAPGTEVSIAIAGDSRVKQSTTVRHRIRRPQASVSDTKSSAQHSFGRVGRLGVSTSHARHPLALLAPETQPSELVETEDPLVVHHQALTAQQHVQSPIPKATSLPSQLNEPLVQGSVGSDARPVPNGGSMGPDQPAGTALGYPKALV
jgi:hypothetical protein